MPTCSKWRSGNRSKWTFARASMIIHNNPMFIYFKATRLEVIYGNFSVILHFFTHSVLVLPKNVDRCFFFGPQVGQMRRAISDGKGHVGRILQSTEPVPFTERFVLRGCSRLKLATAGWVCWLPIRGIEHCCETLINVI